MSDSSTPLPTIDSDFALRREAAMDNLAMDANLMTFVNVLGALTFVSIVVYHFITATQKDAEL